MMNLGIGTRRKSGKLQPFDSMAVLDPDTLTEIKNLFSKVRTYAKPSSREWRIPDPNVVLRHPPQEHCRLQALKVSLNGVKNQLSDKNVQVWHQHTNSTNRAGKVIAAVRSAANAELCTQAWCKFYEILGTFNPLPQEALHNGELNTVHLCEAPGAFITALNHYIKTNQSTCYCDWSWAANTLNPYHEANGGNMTITDDRLIANTLPWWFFGSDNTGNIMVQKHLLELQEFVSNMHRVDMVTADGSFDCQENPDEQEALVASLHFCEVTAALLLLSPGGSFVLKMFTLYEHSSVCLLYLLNCCFHSVSVFKPATSKAGNSEVYVVCLNYEGKEAVRPLLSKLIRNYGPHLADREALIPNSLLPESFLKQHEEVCVYFHMLQVETITENLQLFEEISFEQRQRLDRIRDYTAHEYLQRFQVSFLPLSQWISRHTVTPACCSVSAGQSLGQKKQMGSFNERRELQTLSWRERIERGCHAAWIQRHCTDAGGTGCVLEGLLSECHVDSWYILIGAALPALRNSPFCEGGLLNHLNEALMDTVVDWTHVPPCGSCHVVCTASILSDVAGICVSKGHSDGNKNKRQCLVFGSHSVWGTSESQIEDLVLTFSVEPSPPQRQGITLHDGEPLYQQQLLACVVLSLQSLNSGDALLLPVFSALTRVTAAVVLCLHVCFRSVTFRCPPPTGMVGAVLVCIGFCPKPAARILPFLTDVHNCMSKLLKGEDNVSKNETDRQVLQFVPMDELLTGGLTEFLWTLNSEIIHQKLHLLMQT
uniref:Cap-specific mRNA (nucleoside-2'-O-)-methyltransferase 2 n=1 Tax=Monopterus albus TaxID=43700 RepID=A0A3Q3IE37_MONAL|nr:cap-specific mRNA (nucleoside-2'-O-)-methyltransferase 2 [Monopterus albus]XP_020466269.1 cap-specific mRNA (nucleoside-2'-O-)-methyltransferase 2 [Monopterus albus]XP_020466278.1 cap-specific mRNA (nucleoside-2'-O-)-methyltransferase 2 [Monopterus albus]XP_020466286.1 cap-specific mRNA (nucleoside-2'-O-)-methyltransferase 2 [Monopterus albus]XP_020466294.1 cap-specific mRNA (nucleoside-2'-O-)-methyltransferase 2 [Monopterus albus]XP_020466301.1 cap-specific mRNA (nucleoside-2'-O-)-methyltr